MYGCLTRFELKIQVIDAKQIVLCGAVFSAVSGLELSMSKEHHKCKFLVSKMGFVTVNWLNSGGGTFLLFLAFEITPQSGSFSFVDLWFTAPLLGDLGRETVAIFCFIVFMHPFASSTSLVWPLFSNF